MIGNQEARDVHLTSEPCKDKLVMKGIIMSEKLRNLFLFTQYVV